MQPAKAETTLFPYGVSTQAEVIGVVRVECEDEDVRQIDKILSEWREAHRHFQDIISKEEGVSETIQTTDLDAQYKPQLDLIASDYLFQQSFSMFPLEFRLVELEKLVAAQRYVNLDYVEQLTASLPPKPGMEDLIRFCLSPQRPQPLPKSMQMAPNAMSYSSPSADFRFLGGFPKALSEGDVKAAIGGGVPVAAIVLLVGYGSSTCNAFSVDNRIILNNGFHRVYTLLDMGVKLAPLVIQKITNPGLELPPQIAGLPSDYLVDHARPVLMKDFFDTELVRVIHKKPRIKSVQVAWNSGQSFVPI